MIRMMTTLTMIIKIKEGKDGVEGNVKKIKIRRKGKDIDKDEIV